MSSTIVLADDHQILRNGLRALLEKEHDLEVVGEADNGRIAVEMAKKLSPALVVMDIGMPDLNGVEATRQIIANGLKTRVIALSMHSQSQFVGRMLEAGATGYLLKNCAAKELVKAIRTVLANRIYLSPSIAGVVVEDYVSFRRTPANHSAGTGLTAREREVLQLMAEGNSTKEIAANLHLSVKTIETHRQHIMEKLDIHSVAGLTKYAIREGITPFEV